MNVTVNRHTPCPDKTPMIQEMERDVAVSERNYQRVSKGLIHISEDEAHISHEVDCLTWIERMEKIAKRIASGNGMNRPGI